MADGGWRMADGGWRRAKSEERMAKNGKVKDGKVKDGKVGRYEGEKVGSLTLLLCYCFTWSTDCGVGNELDFLGG
jgi:hypothetical protein